MQLADLIERRRFVGREFVLWLWMCSELFEGTLSTAEHGTFGLWIDKRLTLSLGEESTRITAAMPGAGREAKEALRRGQLPDVAGLRIAWKDDETALALDAEAFAVAGLKLRTVLGGAEASEGGFDLVDELAGKTRGRPKKKRRDDDAGEHDDSAFYERMQMTSEVEALLGALYRDFLALRLSKAWDEAVAPSLRRWAAGDRVDPDAFREACARSGRAKGAKNGRAKGPR